MESTLKRTWAEIDLDHLTHNFEVIRRRVGDKVKLLGVVKADGYGHGAVEIAKRLEQLGAGYLAVSNIDECEELRDSGVTLPILMLGFTPADQTARILQLHMTQAVQSYDIAKEFSDRAIALGGKMTVHVKLDTGMGRLGFSCDEAHFDASLRDILRVLELPGLDIEGVFTHFSVSDEDTAESVEFTKLQHERFARMIEKVETQSGFRFQLHHCCNAGGIVSYPEWAWDMVRCGIILYGSGDLAEKMGMQPVMSLKTRVATIKDFAAGEPISYGRTYFTPHCGPAHRLRRRSAPRALESDRSAHALWPRQAGRAHLHGYVHDRRDRPPAGEVRRRGRDLRRAHPLRGRCCALRYHPL